MLHKISEVSTSAEYEFGLLKELVEDNSDYDSLKYLNAAMGIACCNALELEDEDEVKYLYFVRREASIYTPNHVTVVYNGIRYMWEQVTKNYKYGKVFRIKVATANSVRMHLPPGAEAWAHEVNELSEDMSFDVMLESVRKVKR